MSELFSSGPLVSALIMVGAAVVLGIQYLCGYKTGKSLGSSCQHSSWAVLSGSSLRA